MVGDSDSRRPCPSCIPVASRDLAFGTSYLGAVLGAWEDRPGALPPCFWYSGRALPPNRDYWHSVLITPQAKRALVGLLRISTTPLLVARVLSGTPACVVLEASLAAGVDTTDRSVCLRTGVRSGSCFS